MGWYQDIDGNVFEVAEPQASPLHRGPSLQDSSGISAVKRGTLIRVPAGQTDGPIQGAIPLRVEAGTWAFTAFRVDLGIGGIQVAAAPPNTPGQIRWPFRVALQHGVGAITWLELIDFAARGTTFVRAGDYLEAQVFYQDGGAGPIAEELAIVLAATQLIVAQNTCFATSEAIADGNGLVRHTVVPGATTMQYLGPVATAFIFRDIDGTILAQTLNLGSQIIRVPLNAATVDMVGTGAASPSTVQWEIAL